MSVTTVGALLSLLEGWFDPGWAEPWDAVGLVGGEPGAAVDAVHLAVDPTPGVADEAVAAGAGLLVTHHPLWLGGTTAITGDKGRAYHRLAEAGCALYVAHTNADVANPGVSDALAETLGLAGLRPVSPRHDELDRWVVHVPRSHSSAVLEAMAGAGAGALGRYDRCAFVSPGLGTFRPLPGASPHLGEVGRVEQVAEDRLELVGRPAVRAAVAAALRAAHPYEEPSFTVTPALVPSGRGLGRIGELPDPVPLGRFVEQVAAALPATAAGVRASGPPDLPVRTVAVAGGSCLDLAGTACAAGADVLVTSDARHHRAQEAPLAVVDVAHWAGEWPWTRALGARLAEAVPGLAVTVSTLVTDPWTLASRPRPTV